MTTRFAPSPTGFMHFGNLRTGLFNYLLAKKNNENFILRIEDTDRERSKEEYSDSIKEDLNWVGVSWNSEEYQSKRRDIYENYYNILIEKKLAYPCYCSEEKLKIIRKSQLSQGIAPRYPGTCYNLTKEEIAKKEQEIKNNPSLEKAALRFRVDPESIIEFVDLIKGKQKFLGKDIGDFIIRRNTGDPSFMFCNAIDDAKMQVTKVLRGEDHLSNVPRQILILQALDLPISEYGHFPMINGQDGAPLSKRNGSEAVKDLKEHGFHPLAIINYLARLGHNIKNNKLLNIQELSQEFSLDNISSSSSGYDKNHLKHWQKEAMLHSSDEQLLSMIESSEQANGLVNKADSLIKKINKLPGNNKKLFLELLKNNILMPIETKELYNIFFSEGLKYTDDNIEIIKTAGQDFYFKIIEFIKNNFDNIENKNKDNKIDSKNKINYKELINYLKTNTDKKGKNLFMPIRIALTNQMHGAELDKIIDLIGNKEVLNRFNNCIEIIQVEKKDEAELNNNSKNNNGENK